METDGGGWTVFQRRQDGSVDFYRNWSDYENGFGTLTGEHWLGLPKIHRITQQGTSTLRVELKDINGNTNYAKYSTFNIGSSSTQYTLTVSGYSGSGTAGDCLTYHNGMKFSTKDKDNDAWSGTSCATFYTGAWWYDNCYYSSLNGQYHESGVKGIAWNCKTNISLKFTEMKARRN